MSSESEDNDQPRPPKTRGEVYAQEQQRIAEETRKYRFHMTSRPRVYSLVENSHQWWFKKRK